MSSVEMVMAIMVRAPIPGRVKTRLIPALGAVGAFQLYQAMVSDILGNIKESGLPLHLFYDGAMADLPKPWLDAATLVCAQRGDDIGERMAAVFADCFTSGADPVILVGSDIPALNAPLINQAAAALIQHDAVLVPVEDGGYCLIGLHQTSFCASLFTNIAWSTSQVLAQTRRRLTAIGLRAAFLASLQDIDTPTDLLAYLRNPASTAASTNQMINEIFLV